MCEKRDIPADPGVQAVVDQYLSKLEEGMKEVIGELDCELEGRFSELRTRETNLDNLITDIMRRATRADVALINSGTDTIHEAGEFKMKIRNWFLNLRGLLNFHPLTCEARE